MDMTSLALVDYLRRVRHVCSSDVAYDLSVCRTW